MLFVGGNVSVDDEWERHPFHRNNNVNGIDGDGTGNETMTMSDHPRVKTVRDLQVAYVRKVVDTLNDLDNVLFEVINEGGTKEWDWFIVRLIHDYEKTKAKQHPAGLTGHGGETNESMLASPAEWFSPGAREWPDLRTDPRPAEGTKVSIPDTDHIWGEGGDHRWVWKSFLRGHNPIYMDRLAALAGDSRGNIPDAEKVRQAMGQTRTMANRMNLMAMVPRGDLASSAYCLANPGVEYLVYQPKAGESFSVELKTGTYGYEWFDPTKGVSAGNGTVKAPGGVQQFNAPFEGDAVLYLKAANVPE